jgi:alpha-1,6-mannosyltransferase
VKEKLKDARSGIQGFLSATTDKQYRSTMPLLRFAAQLTSPKRFWGIVGLTLIGCHMALAWLSPEFHYGRPLSEEPVTTLVALLLTAGAIFLIAAWRVAFRRSTKETVLPWVICVGIFLRGIMFVSTPMLEYDYYRYLWDGAVLANGINPFLYSPKQAVDTTAPVASTLGRLAHESGDVLARVSFPELRTIYPPVAQAAFAAAYVLRPWSEFALRTILALFDAATLILLLIILRDLKLSLSLVVIYWWNPLVIREIFNTMHLDVIALPFALAAVVLALKGRQVEGAVALALAVAAKLWPLVLLPVILRPLFRAPRRLFISLGVFGLASAILFLPVFLSGIDDSSGFVAYGRYWEMNDAAYRLILSGVKYGLAMLSLDMSWGQATSRTLACLILAFWALWLTRSELVDPKQAWNSCLLIVAAVFLLSPTGFPWYYLWVVPFLAISPRPSLLLLNCFLPLYYLVYHYRGLGDQSIFDNLVVWAEYLPFVFVAFWELLRSEKSAIFKSL